MPLKAKATQPDIQPFKLLRPKDLISQHELEQKSCKALKFSYHLAREILLVIHLLEKISRPQEFRIAVEVSQYTAIRCNKHNVQPPYFMAGGHFHMDRGVNFVCSRLSK